MIAQRMDTEVLVLVHLYSSQNDYSLQISVTSVLRLLFTYDKLRPSFPKTSLEAHISFHFISWVSLAGLSMNFLNHSNNMTHVSSSVFYGCVGKF